MAGPSDAALALVWIRDAVAAGRYFAQEPHFSKRCRERGVQLDDWKHAIASAPACRPYADRAPTQGGSVWSVVGTDLDGDALTVSVEAFLDHLGQRALLITVF
jgi:hypothetical protein